MGEKSKGSMTLHALTTDWLREYGYDGLFNAGVCACKLDDLMPCDEPSLGCEAGYLAACKGGDDWCDGDCGFHILAVVPGASDE